MKVYIYQAKSPITDREAIDRQLRLACEYQRALTAIEIQRRQAVEALYRDRLPAEHAACDAVEAEVVAAIAALHNARSARVIGEDDVEARAEERTTRAALMELRERQKATWDARRRARRALTPTIRPELAEIDRGAHAAEKATYNAPQFAALAWGTKLSVAASAERAGKAAAKIGSLPHMPSFDGSGALSVQLINGLMPADIEVDTRFRLEPLGWNDWMARRGRTSPFAPQSEAGRYAIAHIRIGSNPDRSPIWASWPIYTRRPLPDAPIKWARAVAKKIGTRVDWSIQVTVDEAEVPLRSAQGPALAVNLGWRNLADGGIRVAYAVGSDGREEEVRVPERFRSFIASVDSIRAIRDHNCELALSVLRSFCDDPDRETPLPEWFSAATQHCASWRGPKRLARLAREWETQRFAGDERTFAALWMWRNGKDASGHSVGNHHLRFRECDKRERAYRYRNEIYRQIARRWAHEYARIIVTDMDLRDFAELPAPEEGRQSKGQVQRRTRMLAGPSILRREMKNACANAGARWEEKKGAWTQTCAACGVQLRFDARFDLMRTCGACGAVDDQDRNHCRAMLASAAVMGPPIAAAQAVEAKAGRWVRRRSQKRAKEAENTRNLE